MFVLYPRPNLYLEVRAKSDSVMSDLKPIMVATKKDSRLVICSNYHVVAEQRCTVRSAGDVTCMYDISESKVTTLLCMDFCGITL